MGIAIIVVASVATALVIWASSYYVGTIDQKNKDLQEKFEFASAQLHEVSLSYNALAQKMATTLEKHVVASSSTETETN